MMKNCKFCSTVTPNTRIWKLGNVRFISPFCSDECIEEIRPARIANDYDRIKTLVNIKDEQFGKNND